ncbi:Peptidase family M48 family protein [Raphanus sativus]|nr:Peptidase family M48 family protein [Raphanus sativus]
MINAFCLSGGNIVYYYGLLAYFKSDAEVATIMAPEFGHAVARHTIEGITKGLGFVIIQLVLYHFSMPDFVNKMSPYFMPLPHSRKMEIEADYIGLLLLASVGYDPQMAPKVFEKLVKLEPSKHMILNDYLTTHPSGEKRARLLSQANVMEEALRIYREVQYWSLH